MTGAAAVTDERLAEIQRLARLSPLEYDDQRLRSADYLGVRVSSLDKTVADARKALGVAAAPGSGRALDLPTPEPAEGPVDGQIMAQVLQTLFERHLALPPHAAPALVLWALHTHAIDASHVSPRLAVVSPEPRCGKTTLLRVLEGLVPRPLLAANITPAAVFRTIETASPTFLIDEAHTFLTASDDLRRVLKAGHRRSGTVIRLVGNNHEPRAFRVFCATAIACIGKLPATLMDRALVVRLRRALPGEVKDRFRADRRAMLDYAARNAARWAIDNVSALAGADPNVPPELNDRAADNWRPLLAIADALGGDWPERARMAALAMSGNGDGETTLTTLLGDIKTIFDNKGAER